MKPFSVLFFWSLFSLLPQCYAAESGNGRLEQALPPSPSKDPGAPRDPTVSKDQKDKKDLLVSLGLFNIPVLGSDSLVGYVDMRIILKAKDPAAAKTLKDQQPRVRHSFWSALYGLVDLLWGSENEINKISLRQHLDKVCADLLGVDLLDDVFIQNIKVRKMS